MTSGEPPRERPAQRRGRVTTHPMVPPASGEALRRAKLRHVLDLVDVAAGQVLAALVTDDLGRALRWAHVLEALVMAAPPVDQDRRHA